MLRSELIASVNKLVTAINDAKILQAIAENEPPLSIYAYHMLAESYKTPSQADRHLFKVLNLEPLLDLGWWAEGLAHRGERSDRSERPNRPDRDSRPAVHSRVTFAIRMLPQIIELLRPVSELESGASRITLLVPESENQTSSPARIVSAIESVVLIYTAISKLHNEQENTLALRSCDSGSDKSFDFTGLPQIIEQVKGFYLVL